MKIIIFVLLLLLSNCLAIGCNFNNSNKYEYYNCTMWWHDAKSNLSCYNNENNISCISYKFIDNQQYLLFNCTFNSVINKTFNESLCCGQNNKDYYTKKNCVANNITYIMNIKFNTGMGSNKLFFILFFTIISIVFAIVVIWNVINYCEHKRENKFEI